MPANKVRRPGTVTDTQATRPVVVTTRAGCAPGGLSVALGDGVADGVFDRVADGVGPAGVVEATDG
jgi:hypothetical protein